MMRIPALLALAAASLFTIACGGTTDSTNESSSTGTATFSGAVTGTVSLVVIAIEADASTQTPAAVIISGTGSGITFQTDIGLNGYSLAATTYTPANTNAVSGSIVFDSQTYGLISGASAGTDAVGTFSLSITDAGTANTAQGLTVYSSVHGTLTATYDLNQTAGNTPASVSLVF